MSESNDPRLLRLHPADNVLTVISALNPDDVLRIGGEPITMTAAVAIGHKLAGRAILSGEKILKYGAPIGSAIRDIAAGEHVHTHNVKSDYLPTFLREDQSRFFAQEQHP